MAQPQVQCANLRKAGELDGNYDRSPGVETIYSCAFFHHAVNPSKDCHVHCGGYASVRRVPTRRKTSAKPSRTLPSDQSPNLTHTDVLSRLHEFKRRLSERPDCAKMLATIARQQIELERSITAKTYEFDGIIKDMLHRALALHSRNLGPFPHYAMGVEGVVLGLRWQNLMLPYSGRPDIQEFIDECSHWLADWGSLSVSARGSLRHFADQIAEFDSKLEELSDIDKVTKTMRRIYAALLVRVHESVASLSAPFADSQWDMVERLFEEAERCFDPGISTTELEQIECYIAQVDVS